MSTISSIVLNSTNTSVRTELMCGLMDRACRCHELSRRQLASQLGVSVGTVNSYYLRKVDPFNCRLVIQQRLADLNGTTMDELTRFYGSGDWAVIGLRWPQVAKPVVKGLSTRRVKREHVSGDEGSPLLQAGVQRVLRGARGSLSRSVGQKGQAREMAQELMQQPGMLAALVREAA
jgi:hypothetical protein